MTVPGRFKFLLSSPPSLLIRKVIVIFAVNHFKFTVMAKIDIQRLSDVSHLKHSWSQVKAKGASSGIDEVSINDYETMLDRRLRSLSDALLSGTWRPNPYLNVRIPKKDGDTRLIGIMSVEDKIVQNGIKILIEPVLDRLFSSSSYAYRPGKGHVKAIRRTFAECCRKSNNVYMRMDIDCFFDTIDRNLLFTRLKHIPSIGDGIRSLIELCLTMGRINDKMEWEESEFGIPQGAILSPLMANFYLISFDQSVLSKTSAYVRYSDDFVILCSSVEEAEELRLQVSSYLNDRLHLKLNDDVKIGQVADGFTFLGLILSKNGIMISEEKLQDLKSRISNIIVKNGVLDPRYLKSLDGIRRYYAALLPVSFSDQFDGLLIDSFSDYMSASPMKPSERRKLIGQLLPFNPKRTIKDLLSAINAKMPDVPAVSSDIVSNKKLIASRKLEYRRREMENTEIIVSSPGYFIGLSNRGVTLRKNGQPLRVPPASALRHITVMSDGVTLSSNLIRFCMEKGVPIDFFDRHCNHIASVLSPVFMQSSLWEAQRILAISERIKLAERIIVGKIKNQMNLCKYFNKYHKTVGVEAPFDVLFSSLSEVLEKIKKTNFLDPKSLMGYEAVAAEAYWEYIRQLMADDGVGFYSRVKKGASDLVNSMLNYGYSLLYPRIWQAILKKKLNPYVGLVHYSEGNPNLVFDVIELFRSQAVDRVVISMIQKKEPLIMKNGLLDEETRNILTRHIMERLSRYEKYRGEERRLSEIIELQIGELASAIVSGTTYRPYIAKW